MMLHFSFKKKKKYLSTLVHLDVLNSKTNFIQLILEGDECKIGEP